MSKLKFLIISFLMLFSLAIIQTKQKLPFIIKSQNETFNKIAKDLKDNLPKNIEILLLDISLINGSDELIKKLNDGFYQTLISKQEDYNYSIKSEKNIIEENNDIDIQVIKKESELELIALGKYLNLDAILISSITLIEDERKRVWNKETKSWEYKRTALFQGNIFSTENNISLYRFSHFFYL